MRHLLSIISLAALATTAFAVPHHHHVHHHHTHKKQKPAPHHHQPQHQKPHHHHQPSGGSSHGHLPVMNTPAHAPVGFTGPVPMKVPTHPITIIPNEPHQPGGQDRDYMGTVLLHHNYHRRNATNHPHDLVWGFALERIAMDIAHSCVFEHDLTQQGGGYGQSLVAGIPATTIGKAMSPIFYNNQEPHFTQYGAARPDMSSFDSWGFYTQMVWKSTREVACYTVDCSGKGLKGAPPGASPDFTVCNYWPPGNIDGEYAENVGHPGDMATMEWCDDSYPFRGNCGRA